MKSNTRQHALISCILYLSALFSMQACAAPSTDSASANANQYKSASTELNEAFQVGDAVAFENEDDIGLVGRYHFATHTRDFDKARAFYWKIGFTEGVGGFPLTNTLLLCNIY